MLLIAFVAAYIVFLDWLATHAGTVWLASAVLSGFLLAFLVDWMMRR